MQDSAKQNRLVALQNFLAHPSIPFILLVGCAIVVGFLPVILSVLSPTLNNSAVVTLCASAQFFISLFAGIALSKRQAEAEANMRWVPMAASACDRLVTIIGSVRSLRMAVGQACGNASKNLPELSEERNRVVRVHFEGLCSSNATRLQDVELHLESDLADWERFVKHNCSGGECADIGRRLLELRARLKALVPNHSFSTCNTQPPEAGVPTGTTTNSAANFPVLDIARVVVSVNGVTTRANANGTWDLVKISEDQWSSEKYVLRKTDDGWYVEDRGDTHNYFFRDGTGPPGGVYERCLVCPDDGSATVTVVLSSKVGSKSPGASTTDKQITDRLFDVVLHTNLQVQHLLNCHHKSIHQVRSALESTTTMKEFCGILGTRCSQIVHLEAVRSLNALRGYLGKPPYAFDQQLFNEAHNGRAKKQPAVVHKPAVPSTTPPSPAPMNRPDEVP